MIDNETYTAALVVFGRDFEKHGGMRALALASVFGDDDEVEHVNYLPEASMILGEELTEEGGKTDDELEEIHNACGQLRLMYEDEGWIFLALAHYFRLVKGMHMEKAEEKADALLAKSRKRYAKIYAAYRKADRGSELRTYQELIAIHEQAVKDLRKHIEAIEEMESV